LEVTGSDSISYITYDFLLTFHSNYGSTLCLFEIFNVEIYCDLDVPVKGQTRLLKVVPFDRLASDVSKTIFSRPGEASNIQIISI